MKKLSLSLILPQLAGGIGAFFTISSINSWYRYLNKPTFSPPNWVFGPVWFVLYLLMGLALYLNWIKKTKQAKLNVRLFFIQLFFNLIWTPVFFGMKNLFLSLLIIFIIWLLIIVMIFQFYKVNKPSSWLLLPYFFWVSFAGLLNYFIWKLN
ncbi:tryptophan-rich sensory protein [Patescibacteria group bacterium]|nr:tryptophan-rich sensory protein [Patescibacteria group bacterium]